MTRELRAQVTLAPGTVTVPQQERKGGKMTRIRIETSRGVIVAELDADKAPVTVSNFLSYAKEGFYDGTVFHRVIDGFMIQGGGFTPDMGQKKGKPAIRNEAGNGLRNLRGTLAMARTPAVDSATSQFFINLVDNDFLDHRNKTPAGFGYAVFGRVVEGMDVVDAIGKVDTGTVRGFQDVPLEPVVMVKVAVVK
ncbi:MAG: peptidyl-prolyl cis-trans isomerase [bacterium]|nr:MAG: peptidyl-prolyl cis-trans isomerase [bacterium]